MNILAAFYPGDGVVLVALATLLQVTLITFLALLLMRLAKRRGAARRHAVGVSALVVLLVSPLLAWFASSKMALVDVALPRFGGQGDPDAVALQNHLEPWGPIMRLHPEPIVLTDEMQTRDRAYWDALSNRLLGLTSFARDPLGQKAFAELRSAIAGLYRRHGRLEEAEYAYKQAVQLCPIYTGASWGLADLHDGTGRRGEAREVLTRFKALAPERNHKQLEKWLQRLDEEEEKGI